jgi:hypothetical protein
MSRTRVFTFGYGQTDPRTRQPLDDCYVVVEVDEDGPFTAVVAAARRKMLDRFGNAEYGGNWAFDYSDEESAGVEMYGLTQIDFITGKAVKP